MNDISLEVIQLKFANVAKIREMGYSPQPVKPESLVTGVDTFGKYTIRIDIDTAETILELVRGLDYSAMTKAQVWALNGLQLNLEAIKEETNV